MKNSTWAHCLIDQLILQGVCDFCIAPGSRSTPLALAAARHKQARIKVHFDERGLGFYALGLSLSQQKPAALIVTSGTAVGNLLPAVMEAHHSRVPLIILTADRPPEHLGCGHTQTTNQTKIFNNFVLWQADLPCPDEFTSENFIRSQASEAVFQAMRMGPVHLNGPFREPLFSMPEQLPNGLSQPIFHPRHSPDPEAVKRARQMISDARRGLILIGRLPPNSNLAPIFALAKQLQWPIMADLLSSARTQQKPNELIIHHDFAIRSKLLPPPDLTIHFGGSFISKALLEWMNKVHVASMHIDSHIERIDPLHLRPTRICADPSLFCQALQCPPRQDTLYLNECQSIDQLIQKRFEDTFLSEHPFTEADMMRKLAEHLPKNWSVFFGNSMPIRDAEHFFMAQPRSIFANRGLSGIDGQIATAAGIASHTNAPMMAIIGDQSALHDLNSIALLRRVHQPFLLVISNNNGGGIFSRLPVSSEPVHFDQLYTMSHHLNFENIAKMFNLTYQSSLLNWEDLFRHPKPTVLEVFTSHKENAGIEIKILQNCMASIHT
ncbi:MAG: menD [Parachlamydiales bacterium]|nr:menD [Parachlamydiales bacterium]